MKYFVSGQVIVSCYCHVEASSKQEAIEKSQELYMGSLCHQACQSDPREAWIVDDLDGEPITQDAEPYDE